MAKERFKVILKWGLLLMMVSAVLIFGVSFVVGLLAIVWGLNSDRQQVKILGAILAMIVALPFSYLFSYQATREYLAGGKDRYQKNIGINIGLGVVLVATLIGGIVGYLLIGQINISTGLVPLILGLLAGKKAESKFSFKS